LQVATLLKTLVEVEDLVAEKQQNSTVQDELAKFTVSSQTQE
jgi:hypothetical protein